MVGSERSWKLLAQAIRNHPHTPFRDSHALVHLRRRFRLPEGQTRPSQGEVAVSPFTAFIRANDALVQPPLAGHGHSATLALALGGTKGKHEGRSVCVDVSVDEDPGVPVHGQLVHEIAATGPCPRTSMLVCYSSRQRPMETV